MDQQQPVQQAANQKPEAQRNPRVLWWLVVMLAAALGLGMWSWVSNDEAKTNLNASTTNVSSTVNTNTTTTFLYPGKDGKNVLELLKNAYPNTMTKTSSLGEYVTVINGVAAASNQGWVYTVNGAEVAVGADKYVTKATDIVEWKLTSF